MSITRNIIENGQTAITKDFHERILTIDNTNDTAEINKVPVANEYGYLDKSWLQDYSGYKINDVGDMSSNLIVQTEDTEFINVITLKSVGLKITLAGDYVTEEVPYTRALIYRFLIYNPDGYDLTWDTDYPEGEFIWNTYSETPPALDEYGTYIEFISTDRGAHWYGIATDMTAYDIVNNYYTKTESDGRFVNVTGDAMSDTLKFINGRTGPFSTEPTTANPFGEVIHDQILGVMAGSDSWRLGSGSTASDTGFLEIATSDNAREAIYVSQYTGGDGDGFENASLTRRATILDINGNTSFPGNVTIGGNDVVGGNNNRILSVYGDSNINGAVTINNLRDAQYATNTHPALTIGDLSGYHIQLDGDEIIAKRANSPETLYLNRGSGGSVVIGDGGLSTSGPINTTKLSTSATPGTTDRSTYVATTAYVRNYIQDYIEHWLVPPMDNTTKAMCLTNDGTSSHWVTYSNAPYVYYVSTDTTSLTVPSAYLVDSIVTEVYRNGVLLINPDDYTINNETGVINFKDTIGNGEKIIVTLENAVRIHTNEVLTGVTLNNSMASTPESTDSSNRIATTEYVNRVLDLVGSSGGQSSIATHSPVFTGTPTAPTAAEGTNTTQIATTEFVTTAINNSNHAPINSPQFTGIPTAPNPNINTNNYQIATTAFVVGSISTKVLDGVNSNLNTLKKIAIAINNDPNYFRTVNDAINGKISRGITHEGPGNAVTNVTESNGIIKVTKGSTFSLADHNHDDLYTPITPSIGSDINPIFTDENGAFIASTETVGSSINPIYFSDGNITASDATIGSSSKPIYMENGELLESDSTIGSSDTPVYINNGTITSTNKNFSDYLPLTGGTITGTLTLTSEETTPLIIGDPSDQHVEINNNSIASKLGDNFSSDLHVNETGGDVYFGNVIDGEVIISNGVITANSFVGNIGGTSERATQDSQGNVIHTTYATINSPEFTGIPTAPTPSLGESSSQIATTEFVDNTVNDAIAGLVNSAPETLDTLKELSDALGADPNFATTITNELGNKLDTDSDQYIKSISIDGNTITVTAGDNSTSTLVTQGTTYTAGNGITIENEVISATEILPSQTDNAGKVLSTDGTSAIWVNNGDLTSDIKISKGSSPEESVTINVTGYNTSTSNNIGNLGFTGNDDNSFIKTELSSEDESVILSQDKTVDGDYTIYNQKSALKIGGSEIALHRDIITYTGTEEDIDDVVNVYTSAPTPIAGDNSSKIATTAFVTNAINNIDALPDQTNNAGKYLITNGTSASWEDITNTEIKISSIHYPSEGSNTITLTGSDVLPSDVSKYALAIYRDGVYLNPTIDYTFDHNTNVLTFSANFDQDEVVTVIFSYISSDTQATLDIDVDEYEAGENITFVNNPNTGKITINAAASTATDSTKLGGVEASNYALLSSPELTGTPTAPTAAAGTSTTQIATTAFVTGAISNLVSGAPSTLDTLKEIADVLNDSSTGIGAVNTALEGKLNTNITTTGSGNAITAITDSNGNITATKGSTFSLSDHNHNSDYLAKVTSKGSATKGVYVDSNGAIQEMTYTVSKNVPSDAVFTDTNTKVNVTLGTTTKAYLLGTSTTPTSTAAGVTAISDTGVYLDTTAGMLTATTFKGNLSGNLTATAPTAPTATTTTNNTQIATTAYVNNRFANSTENVKALTSAATIAINPTESSLFTLTLTRNATINISTISNGYYTTNGAVITLFMPAHNYTVSWGSSISWVGGSAPDLSESYNIITFATPNGGTTWYGSCLNV